VGITKYAQHSKNQDWQKWRTASPIGPLLEPLQAKQHKMQRRVAILQHRQQSEVAGKQVLWLFLDVTNASAALNI